jgi:hypothetical protein
MLFLVLGLHGEMSFCHAGVIMDISYLASLIIFLGVLVSGDVCQVKLCGPCVASEKLRL